MEKLLESARGKPESNLEAEFQNSLSDKLVGMDRMGFLDSESFWTPQSTQPAPRLPHPTKKKSRQHLGVRSRSPLALLITLEASQNTCHRLTLSTSILLVSR